MHQRPHFLAVPFLLATVGLSQVPAVAPGSPAEAWQRFVRNNPGDWQVEWSKATGTPIDLWGPGLRLQQQPVSTVDDARRLAVAALGRFGQLLGKGTSTFVEDVQAKANHAWVFGYRQEFRGLPCIGGRAKVVIHDVGVLSLLGSTALPVPKDFGIRPQVGIDQARMTAYLSQGIDAPRPPILAKGFATGDRLVVWGDVDAAQRTPVRLAWEIHVKSLPQWKVGRVYVDAQSGRPLDYVNDLHTCGFEDCPHDAEHRAELESVLPRIDVSEGAPVPGATDVTGNVMGWVNTGVGPADPLVNVPMENLLVQIVGGNSAYTDTAGNFTIPNAGSTSVNLNIVFTGKYCAKVTPSQGTPLNLTIPATPGTPVNVQIYTSTPAEYDLAQINAYWGADDANQFVRSFGASSSSSLDAIQATTSLASACNAFYQNYTINFYHATPSGSNNCVNSAYPSVIYHEWAHGFDDANGGLNQNEGMSEGSSDFLSMAILNDPTVGKDFFGPGTLVRTGLNTRTYPAGGGVHQQGETWMGWGWDVYLNLQSSIGNPAALKLFRQIAVGHYAFNPGSQASGVLAGFMIDDDDGNLNNGTPHCRDLALASLKRKLPNPSVCQGVANYVTYGTSCGVTNLPPCASLNPNGGTLRTGGVLQEWAYEATAPAASNVTGFQIFTQAVGTSSATSTAYIYRQSSTTGQPNLTASSTATLTTTSAAQFYTVNFGSWVAVQQGEVFYVAVNGTTTAISNLTAGTVGNAYTRVNGTSTQWTTMRDIRPSFLVVCSSSAASSSPQLSNTGFPTIGQSMSVDTSGGPATVSGVVFFGGSKTAWGPIPLPLDLTVFGAPTCSLLASGEVQIGITTDPSGNASVGFTLPNSATLVGKQFFNQVILLYPPANTLGVLLSNGGEGTVGQ